MFCFFQVSIEYLGGAKASETQIYDTFGFVVLKSHLPTLLAEEATWMSGKTLQVQLHLVQMVKIVH